MTNVTVISDTRNLRAQSFVVPEEHIAAGPAWEVWWEEIEQDLYLERNSVPCKLQRKVVKIGHNMEHLGITKTKQKLRNRYWFPNMNSMIENILGQ